jgi:hypothetical protein
MVVLAMVSIGCATGGVAEQAASGQDDREWDAFCANPPPDQVRWCDQREREKDRAIMRQMATTQQQEHESADRERRRQRALDIWRATQAPWETK